MSNTGPVGPIGPVSPSGPVTGPVGPNGINAANQLAQTSKTNLNTSGWYMFAAISGGILLGGTPVAPLVLGILTIALIYQTGLALEGK